MNLKHYSDEVLDQKTILSVKTETNSTLSVLHHLREIERRRLFSKLKYKSLHDYAERHLGYPYDQACRRIAAMWLIQEIPEAEEKIANGSLNLTNIGYAQAAFKAEAKSEAPLTKEEKLIFLERIENKSTRLAQKIVAEEFGTQVLIRETVKPVTKEISMLSIPVNDGLLAKIEKAKGLLAHSHAGISTADLLDQALEVLIQKIEKQKQSIVAAPRLLTELEFQKDLSATKSDHLNNSAGPTSSKNRKNLEETVSSTSPKSRYISAANNREIWCRDKQECSNCGSTYALERDHQIPFAKGGGTDCSNLRILCRPCNQRAAIESYGFQKMEKYLNSPSNAYSH